MSSLTGDSQPSNNVVFGFSINEVITLFSSVFKIPKEVKITIEKQTVIKINGVDKELVSKIAADIKNLNQCRL